MTHSPPPNSPAQITALSLLQNIFLIGLRLTSWRLMVLVIASLSGLAQAADDFTPTGSLVTPPVPFQSMNQARNQHTATLLPGGQVLIAGGGGAPTLQRVPVAALKSEARPSLDPKADLPRLENRQALRDFYRSLWGYSQASTTTRIGWGFYGDSVAEGVALSMTKLLRKSVPRADFSFPAVAQSTMGVTYAGNVVYAGPLTSVNRDVMDGRITGTITRSGSVATLVTLAPHGLRVGRRVTVSGATQSEYNGTFDVASVPTSTTLTYNVPGTPATPATGPISVYGGIADFTYISTGLHVTLGNGASMELDAMDSTGFDTLKSFWVTGPGMGSVSLELINRNTNAVISRQTISLSGATVGATKVTFATATGTKHRLKATATGQAVHLLTSFLRPSGYHPVTFARGGSSLTQNNFANSTIFQFIANDIGLGIITLQAKEEGLPGSLAPTMARLGLLTNVSKLVIGSLPDSGNGEYLASCNELFRASALGSNYAYFDGRAAFGSPANGYPELVRLQWHGDGTHPAEAASQYVAALVWREMEAMMIRVGFLRESLRNVNTMLAVNSYSSAELYDPATSTFTTTSTLLEGRTGHTATLLSNGKVLFTGGIGANGTVASAELYDPATGTFTATMGSMTQARTAHTATLLSSGKVLVTGGIGDLGLLASAELYDPATGIFTPTGSLNQARSYHTATLLSNGKVLFAGGTGSGVLASAEVYDPATGTFTATTGSLAQGRAGHTATLLSGGKVLFTGGSGDLGLLASAEVYDPATGTFTATTGSLNQARFYHTATLLSDGKVLFTGGYDENFTALKSAEVYELATGTFTPTGNLNQARHDHMATLLSDGKVLITGGFDENLTALKSAELYDPATGTFVVSRVAEKPGRSDHTATLLLGGQVLITGGLNEFGDLASAGLYDPAAGTFTSTGSMTQARTNHTATPLPDGKVLITAGDGDAGFLANAEVYDPATGTFTFTGSMNEGRFSHTATPLSSGKVLITGGYGANGTVTSAELYDPAAGTFTATTGSMNVGRTDHTATPLSNGKVLITGGYGANGTVASAELYDPATGTFTPTGNLNGGRRYHTATLLSDGKVLIAGGEGAPTSAELYDPAAGTFTPTASLTTGRTKHAATLLSGGRVLITGGGNFATLASAELYDPTAGTFTATTGSMNEGRSSHTATLLPGGNVLIAAGGGDTAPLASAELYTPSKADVRPDVFISAPTEKQQLSLTELGAGSIRGIATNSVGVTRVRLLLRRFRSSGAAYWNGSSFGPTHTTINTTLSGTGTSVIWSLNSAIPASQLDVGSYFLNAIAYDAAGNTTHSTTREFSLFRDITAPGVTIAAPTEKQQLSLTELGIGSIRGTATDNVGVARVRLVLRRFRSSGAGYWNGTSFGPAHAHVGTTLSGTGTNITWSLQNAIPASQLDVGIYFLTAVVTDAAGNTTYSTTREFSLYRDTTTPSVTIAAPSEKQRLHVSELVSGTIRGSATDNVGVARVRLVLRRFRSSGAAYWNGSAFVSSHTPVGTTLTGSGTNATWSLNSAIPAEQLDAGSYFLTAVAYDAAGNMAFSPTREFIVHNDSTTLNSVLGSSAGGS